MQKDDDNNDDDDGDEYISVAVEIVGRWCGVLQRCDRDKVDWIRLTQWRINTNMEEFSCDCKMSDSHWFYAFLNAFAINLRVVS